MLQNPLFDMFYKQMKEEQEMQKQIRQQAIPNPNQIANDFVRMATMLGNRD